MPNPYTITPTPPVSLELKPGERGKFSFTITSLAAPDRANDVMLRALLSREGDKTGKGEEVDWLVAEPSIILNMSGGRTETASITIRATTARPSGDHRVVLVVADKGDPNEVFAESAPMICTLTSPSPVVEKRDPKPSLPWWLVAVAGAGVVLAVAGIAIAWTARGSGGTPSGTIAAFGGGHVPEGWLLCDGKTVSRGEYAALYAAIGDAWGAGDGATTFSVPDLRGWFLRGADDTGVRDPDAKNRKSAAGQPAVGVGSVQGAATAMPSKGFQISRVGDHSHQAPTWTGPGAGYESASTPSGYDYVGAPPTAPAGAHDHTLSGGDSETRPINVAVNYIIKL